MIRLNQVLSNVGSRRDDEVIFLGEVTAQETNSRKPVINPLINKHNVLVLDDLNDCKCPLVASITFPPVAKSNDNN